MPKFIFHWNAGYGESHDCVECKDITEAQEQAEAAWRNEAEDTAEYSAEPLTKNSAEEFGFEEELE